MLTFPLQSARVSVGARPLTQHVRYTPEASARNWPNNIIHDGATYCAACRMRTTPGDLHPFCLVCVIFADYAVCCAGEQEMCRHGRLMKGTALRARMCKADELMARYERGEPAPAALMLPEDDTETVSENVTSSPPPPQELPQFCQQACAQRECSPAPPILSHFLVDTMFTQPRPTVARVSAVVRPQIRSHFNPLSKPISFQPSVPKYPPSPEGDDIPTPSQQQTVPHGHRYDTGEGC